MCCRGTFIRSFIFNGFGEVSFSRLYRLSSTTRHAVSLSPPPLCMPTILRRVLEFFQRLSFRLSVHPVPLHQHGKIHVVRVKLRPIHARKLALPAHQHSASAAHSRAIDHDRIQAHHRMDPRLLRHVRHCLHHRHRSHRQHFIDLHPLCDQCSQLVGHQSLFAIAPIIRRHIQLIAHVRSSHFPGSPDRGSARPVSSRSGFPLASMPPSLDTPAPSRLRLLRSPPSRNS